jgi:DNA-binding beta-propeller fold protein YncE
MPISETFPQLTFQMNDESANNTVYITKDPSVNKLTLIAVTNTENTKFTPGKLVSESEAETATGSILYLDLANLNLSDQDLDNLALSADGWSFQAFKDAGKQICMTPVRDIVLSSGSSIQIKIQNLVLSNPPATSSVQLAVNYYRVVNITEGDSGISSSFQVALRNPPGAGADLHTALDISVDKQIILTNAGDDDAQPSSLDLIFSPGSTPPEIIAGKDTSFILTFVYDKGWPGFGALTTKEKAVKIGVKPWISASSWKVIPDKVQQNPSWELKPPAGEPILVQGTGNTLGFKVDNIMTNFEPGPTLMLVTYSGVPGFKDGVYSILLNKVPRVKISSLTAEPNPAVLEEGTAKVSISWVAKNAVSLTLLAPSYEDVTGLDSFEAELKRSTHITLVAVGAGEGNIQHKNITAEILPVINSFIGHPISIYQKDFPYDVNLSWKVASNDGVDLVSSIGHSESFPSPSDNITKQIDEPQMLTLIPKGEDNSFELRRNVLIQAFKVESEVAEQSANPVSVAAAPMAQFIAVINAKDNAVSFVNTLKFDSYTDPITTGSEPADVRFSNDGKFLYAANRNDGSLSIIAIAYDNSSKKYVFSPRSSIQLGAQPQRICVSSDDKYVFASSVTGSSNAGKLVIVERKKDDSFEVKQTVDIGKDPAGLAVSPSGAQVFVTNSGDNTVSVVGYNSIDDSFSKVFDIRDLQTQPVDVAVAGPHDDTLLVLCRGSKNLIVVHSDDHGYSKRQTIAVGDSPSRICTTPDRSYAFISNSGSNSLTMVGCSKGVGDCGVLEPSIKAGSQPTGITISPDGSMAFVANSGGKSFTVLNLANYEMRKDPINLGEGTAPTNAAASPDGTAIVAWHNSLMKFNPKPKEASKGIYITNVPSGTVSRKMDGEEVIKFVFNPVEGKKKAFAIALGKNSIKILDTIKYDVSTLTITIPGSSDGLPRFPIDLSISGDGKDIYAVARDEKGRHSLLVFDCENEYSIVSDMELFKSTKTSNMVLVECSPDGSHVFVLSAVDKKIWTAARDGHGSYVASPTQIQLDSLGHAMAASPDSRYLYILTQTKLNCGVSVVDIESTSIRDTPMPPSYGTEVNLQRLCVTPDGRRLLITDVELAGIRVMDTGTLRIVQSISMPNVQVMYPMGITILNDASKAFFVCMNSNNVAQIDQITKQKI